MGLENGWGRKMSVVGLCMLQGGRERRVMDRGVGKENGWVGRMGEVEK